MEAVAHPVGSWVEVTEKQDPNTGRVGKVIDRGDHWGTEVSHRTLVRFDKGIARARWYRDCHLKKVKNEGE